MHRFHLEILFPCILLLTIICIPASLNADTVDPDVAEAIAQAPCPEAYPQAAAITLFDRSAIEIDQNGQSTTNRHLLIKILQERGKDEYGDQTIRYDKEKERVDILIARTHTPSGSLVEPEKDGISETSTSEVLWASAYSNAVQKGIHFPALEVGAVIELKYQIVPITQEVEKETYFGGTVTFGATDPILEKRFSVIVSKGTYVNHVMVNGNLRPKTIPMGNKQMLTWMMANIPQVIKEPYMVPIENVVPRLAYSSMKSWNDMASWFAKTYFDHLTDDSTIEDFVAAQGWKELPPQDALIKTILYLTTSIRSVPLSLGLAGYEPSDEGKVFEHRYGDCRDKALLGIAMMRELGLTAYPFLINSSEQDVADLPTIKQFDHILLAVDTGENGYQWFDLHDDNAAFGYLHNHLAGKWGLMITPSGGFFFRTPDVLQKENQSDNVYRLSINQHGDLSGTFTAESQGVFDHAIRQSLKDLKERELTMHFQQSVSSIWEGAKLEDYKTSNLKKLDEPVEIELSIRAEEYGVVQGEVVLFYLPVIPFTETDFHNYTSLSKINYPVNIRYQGTTHYRLELTFPDNLSIGYIPPDDAAQNKQIVIHRTTSFHENHLTIDMECTYKTPTIYPDTYSEVKDLYTRLNRPQNWLIIFEQ